MEYLRCVVERITYRNEQNGYSVLRSSIHSMVDRGRDKRYANGKINKGARAL